MTSLDLDAMLKRLHHANARRELATRAEQEHWTYDHLLQVLFAEEVAHRAQTRLNRVSHAAKFPFLKTIDDYDFTFQSTLRLSMLGTFLSPDFVTQGGCLVLSGKPGRGKTHLAVAVAYRAIQNGFDALFTTAAALIDDLSVASRDGELRTALARYVQPAVLVIDELGYLTYGTDAANVLFHVVNERHLKKRAWSSPPTNGSRPGATSFTTPTSPRLSSTASWSEAAPSLSTARPSAPSMSTPPTSTAELHLP